MPNMVRKQIYIDTQQEKVLKAKAKELNIPESEIIRQGINNLIKMPIVPKKDIKAWKEAKRFIQNLITKGPVRGKRRWTREELYDRKISSRH